jgi:stage V sporulation protein G
MEITEVRIKLMEDSDDRLQAFCSITFDNCFVVRDLKIIDGASGPFVAMPSRKLTTHCQKCGAKNHLKAAYCNHCGLRQREDRTMRDSDGRTKLYADIAHPINSTCREMIQTRVIAEYDAERQRSQEPGYVSKYEDDYGYDAGEEFDLPLEPRRHSAETRVAETRVDPAAAECCEVPPPHTALESSEASVEPHRSDSLGESLSGPHRKPAAVRASRPRGEFGAGIFE